MAKGKASGLAIDTALAGDLDDCTSAFINSDLARIYAYTFEQMVAVFSEGIDKKEIVVARDVSGKAIGYAWIAMHGAFYGFPYLKSFAVAKDSRGKGVGTALLNHFIETGFRQSTRLFLLVGAYNERAIRLYEKAGFRKVGALENFIRRGVTEVIMCKYNEEGP